MSYWYEVFDNEQVQLVTRKQVATVSTLFATTVALSGAVLAAAYLEPAALALAAGVVLLAWVSVIRWAAQRMRRLRRIVWCVKLSDRRVVGYDYARRKTSLDWTRVERVEVVSGGLRIYGPAPSSIEIPTLFPNFATVSHRVVHYADFYHVPVFIDGQPWESLDVYALYPFLQAGASPRPPGALEA